jgi:hypothetical protein
VSDGKKSYSCLHALITLSQLTSCAVVVFDELRSYYNERVTASSYHDFAFNDSYKTIISASHAVLFSKLGAC